MILPVNLILLSAGFGLWKEAEIPRENPYRRGRTCKLHRKAPTLNKIYFCFLLMFLILLLVLHLIFSWLLMLMSPVNCLHIRLISWVIAWRCTFAFASKITGVKSYCYRFYTWPRYFFSLFHMEAPSQSECVHILLIFEFSLFCFVFLQLRQACGQPL